MSTSNPNASVPPVPTGTGAASYTFPFLNVNGAITAQSLTTRQPLQIQQGARLLSGIGVPSVSSGVPGDAYLRVDGGGAGATHLYFNHNGSWIGIA